MLLEWVFDPEINLDLKERARQRVARYSDRKKGPGGKSQRGCGMEGQLKGKWDGNARPTSQSESEVGH